MRVWLQISVGLQIGVGLLVHAPMIADDEDQTVFSASASPQEREPDPWQLDWNRALDVYGQLADRGGLHQRSVRHPDQLIAAAAGAAGIVGLHYDEDYDRITVVTGQPTEWLAPGGSL